MKKLKSRIWKKIPFIEAVKINIYAWFAPEKAHDMLERYEHLKFEKVRK